MNLDGLHEERNLPGQVPPGAGGSRGNARISWPVLVFVALALLYVAVHVITAMAARHNPPAACQLLGGTWNIWDGWRCG